MARKENRVAIFDSLRAIATLSVVFIHLSGWFLIKGAQPKGLYILLADISRFAVPMFVFISAALFFIKYKDAQVDKKKYYLGRFKKIFLPYLLVSIIYYIYRLTPLVSAKQKIAFSGWENLLDFGKLFSTVGVFSHLYFVPLIFMFYLLAPWLLRVYKKAKALFIMGFTSLNIVFVLLMANLQIERLYWRWTIVPYLTYVIFGLLFAENYQKIQKIKKESILAFLVLVLTAIIFIYKPYNNAAFNLFGLSSYIYDSLFGLLWLLLLSIIKLPEKINRAISFVSQKSFGIYLFHYMFIDLFFALIVKGIINPPLNIFTYVILLLVVVTLSITSYSVIDKTITIFAPRGREK